MEAPGKTEETILSSALKVFKQKGFDGTTVQDISDEAGTTKSMVNYYFRSKEKLFLHIFIREFKNLFSSLAYYEGEDIPLKEKIRKIVELDIDRLIEIPDLPVFIFTEINHNPEIVFRNIHDIPVGIFLGNLNKQIAREVKDGKIKNIRAEDLMINIQSLTIFPFLAKPMMIRILGMNEKSFKEFLLQRKKEIPEIIWQSIRL